MMEVPLDEYDMVRGTVSESLKELGQVDAEGVLMFCRKYVIHHKRLPLEQRTALLKAMAQLVKDNIDDLGRVAAKKLITLASIEMTKSKDVSDEHQEVASRLLLNVAHWFTKEAYDELLSMFQPRMNPFFFVVLALANLCKEHVHFMVPLLKPVLHTMLSMLPAVTEEKLKWVFCFALGIFSESILAYLFDIEEAPDPTVKKNLFFQEFSEAYDILFGVWLPLNELNVSTAVIETLGQITHLIPFDKLENELPRIIPVILSMYQETASDFCVTQGLYGVLHTAVERNSEELVLQIDSLLVSLHNQICIAVEQPTNQYSQKQQKEILCCFKLLTPSFTYQIVEFLLRKLESTNNQIRLGTLTVLDHLINMVPLYMASQKNQILAGMKLLVLATDNRVKGKLGQIIYTAARHNYLHLEGGKEMVEFIIRQCSLPVVEDKEASEGLHNVPTDVVTDRDLRRLSQDLMKLLTTLPIDNVLWPFLFEFIIPVRYTNALATVCSSLVSLAMKKLEVGSTESFLNYKDNPNIPGPHALLTRLLTMSSSLHQGKDHCAPGLILLQVMGADIHLAAPQVWEKEFPTLLDYLQENAGKTLLQSQWEEKLVNVLFQTLELIENEDWLSQLGKELINHLHSHYNFPQEKGFVYKCLGMVLRLSQNEEMIKRNLQEMLQTVRHNEPLEKEGIAIGVAYCAVTHLVMVLNLLKEFAKLNIFKKTASYFQIIKDQEDIEIIKVKSTLISCYGHIISCSPKDLTPSRMDTEIVENVLNHYNIKILGMKIEVRDLTLKLSLIQAVTQLARASQSDETSSSGFSRKAELLAYMQELIKAEPTGSLLTSVRKSAIDACTSLLKLQPQFSESQPLIQTCLGSVFNLPRLEADKAGEHPNMSMAERQALFNATMESLLNFLKQLLLSDLSPAGLQFLFTNMEIWIQSRKDYAREMAIETTLQLLVFYLEQANTKDKVPSHNLAVLIGYMVLRCTDPARAVRETAIECLYVLLYIQLRFEGMPEDLKDTEVEHLKAIKEGLGQGNCQSSFQVSTDIGKVLSKCMPQDQLLSLLFTLFLGFGDDKSNSSYAASIVTNVLIAKCGASLTDVPVIIKALHKELQSITQGHIIQMVPETHHEGIVLLASTMAMSSTPHLIEIVEQLTPVLANIHESQRITAAAYFGEFLNHAVTSELLLTDTLVGGLLRCLMDDSLVVQWLAVKGLGNAGTGASQRVEKYIAKLLPAMVSVMEQNAKVSSLLTVEAMSSVSKILDSLQPDYADSILTDMARAMEPLFGNRQDKVRAAAFTVLGKLLRFGSMKQSSAYMEHVYSSLTCLLLHLNDKSDEVRTVCRFVLTLIGPLLPSERMCKHFQELGSEEGALDYENYLNATSRRMADDWPDRTIFYIRSCAPFFSSVQTELRENAVTFASFLMQHAPAGYPKSPAANQMCKELISLLSDHVPSVRIKTLAGIQRLYMY
ncbi:hypothetical protein scyTo_0017770 [Scyliorhinus torazame]|uniref:Maestro heat-like repeat-containing protein family member 1 n=1 Tax=Scyliorhinus torazame TaxID=75743 RepID=A0A401Q014_SCYTO|nr:hypothetical protein [Scyliorhinus torazame]